MNVIFMNVIFYVKTISKVIFLASHLDQNEGEANLALT